MSFALLERSRQLIELKRYDGALEMAQKVLEAQPESVEALSVAAIAAMQLNQLDLGETYARQALTLAPESAYQAYILGKVKLFQGKLAEALELGQAALQINPEGINYLILMAEIYFTQSRWEETLTWVKRVRKINPNHSKALEMEATCQINLRQPKKAEEALKQARSVAPESFLGHYLSALQLANSRKFEEGAAHLRESLRINPSFSHAKELFREFSILSKFRPLYLYYGARKIFLRPLALLVLLPFLAVLMFWLTNNKLRFSGLGEDFGFYLQAGFSLAAVWWLVQWFLKVPDTLFNLFFVGDPEEHLFLDSTQKRATTWISSLSGMSVFFGILYLIFPLLLVRGISGLLFFMTLPVVTLSRVRGWVRVLLGIVTGGCLLMGLAALWPLMSQRASHLLFEGMVILWAATAYFQTMNSK
ncbi:MAG: tetratricopeptide repeat protein [Bacteroidia bacterium]|nr:tetratricopeptide repeat protein [Bacteroidia bacterium]